MAIITSGKTFANGEQLSADKLNQVITAATFNASDAVDGSTMTLIGGAMAVADSGIATGKIANGAVTKTKIENVANMKALGNTSGSAAAPQEVAILDENDMSSDSATSLATQQSIKAYVDTTAAPTVGFTPTSYAGGESVTLPNGLIMKFGIVTGVTTTGTALSFSSAFPNAVISATATGNTTNTITINSNHAGKCAVSNVTTSGMKVWGEPSSSAYWQAIGH